MILRYLGLDPSLKSIVRLYDFIWISNLEISGSQMTSLQSYKMFHLVGFKGNHLMFNFKI